MSFRAPGVRLRVLRLAAVVRGLAVWVMAGILFRHFGCLGNGGWDGKAGVQFKVRYLKPGGDELAWIVALCLVVRSTVEVGRRG